MTTVVNNPAPVAAPAANTGGSSFLIGMILLMAAVAVALYFGIPAIRRMGPIQMNIPATQVNMPDKVNVNVTPAK